MIDTSTSSQLAVEEVKKLKLALSFYANKNNFLSCWCKDEPKDSVPFEHEHEHVLIDQGEVARKALREY